jgi:hypothetical protein
MNKGALKIKNIIDYLIQVSNNEIIKIIDLVNDNAMIA